MKQITHGSTFSGIGAPEIAAEMLGWKNEFHCEINPFGRQILDYYFPNSKSYEDITKTDFSEWKGKITVLTGGFPCQPFSYAGKRRGAEDDRFLWPYMLKCIEQVRPTWFIGENVAGITTMAFPSEDVEVGNQTDLFGEGDTIYERREKFVLAEIIENLERIGYDAQPIIIPAVSVGAPHRIDRVFIIARRNYLENTMHSGQLERKHEEQRCERNIWNTCTGNTERICREERTELHTNTNPNSNRRRKVHQPLQPKFADGKEFISNGREFDVTNTDSARQPTSKCESRQEWKKMDRERECKPFNGFKRHLLSENRWRAFPTISPVYRGNDGIPFPLDNLTIPFQQWRKESLKAYGNAIVPQVMYEIFRAIDIIEKQENNE